jgi:hypothetical protein
MRIWQRVLSAFFGEFCIGAEEAIAKGDESLKVTPGSHSGVPDTLLRGVSLYDMTRTTKKFKKTRESNEENYTFMAQQGKRYKCETLRLSLGCRTGGFGRKT